MAYSAIDAATAQIAHDFNNLLSVIFGNASLLEDRVQDVSDKELVEEILKASSQGAALVRQVLVRTQQREFALDPAALNDTIRSTIRQLNPILGSDMDFELDLSDAVDDVGIGRSELERSITNLLLNAREAMADGGQIRIETRIERVRKVSGDDHPGLRPGSYALVTISDSGCGMSPLIQERIFESFYSTKSGEGRGLGLAVVFGVVKEAGGYVDVESRVGHGSSFKLYLPASRATRTGGIRRADRPGPPEPWAGTSAT